MQSEWSKKIIPLHNDVKTLQGVIEIKEGYKECFGFTQKDINTLLRRAKLRPLNQNAVFFT